MSEHDENDVNEKEGESILISPTSLQDNQNTDSNNSDKTKEEKDSSNASDKTDLHIASRATFTERPKIKYNKNDDIEEFDTDEEEEEVKVKEQPSYTNHISYEGDKCVYTEPGTGQRSVWNKEENKWYPEGGNENTSDPMKNYEFDGKHYMYTDKTTNVTYKFIQEKNEWVVKNNDKSEADNSSSDKVAPQTAVGGVYGFENDTHTYTDPSDGSSYFWDKEKNAWFPKVDDEFMAKYQMNYGFTDSSNVTKTPNPTPKTPPKVPEKPKLSKEEKKAENKRKAQEAPTWFEIDERHNTTIYISNLPLDITMDEFKELVCKCGLLARDEKGKDKVKLYTDSSGELKGDARCTYIKVESVNLALDILDGWIIRDKKLSVQKAKFQLKGDYNPSLKPKRKKNYKDKQKKIHEKLLDWRPDKMIGEPLKHERVVIIKNLFQPEDFDKDVKMILEYQQDIRSECIKCGEVKKVVVYDRHPEGVAQVSFKEPEEAQACIQLLNGRWFGQRRITAEIWDGKTKYKIKETEEQIEARINKWNEYLEQDDETVDKNTKNSEDKTKTDSQREAKKSTEDEVKNDSITHSQSSSTESQSEAQKSTEDEVKNDSNAHSQSSSTETA